ncbi:hypothetical protein [Proteus mirabilis]|uniref:hypothetical protein n=1 Tax=Proteus mirabilis TaxID=584 RepID=UPI000B30E832|nr:hypothetical protein [Proteus mirabilis]EMA1122484.1 hypothetical protein [Proteus mirabilis]MBG3110926.1 hypothetical protein [Proteus mirabilis]MBI6488924.1 hypothetical protein [Proteus mirabilis]MCT0128898.1 hypothetical protein [Proteus mirabilis]MDF7352815.1 hypothetical protein [Proteus mirabilis]
MSQQSLRNYGKSDQLGDRDLLSSKRILTQISQWLSPLNSSISRIVFRLSMVAHFKIMFTLYEVLCANAGIPMYPIIFVVLSERSLIAHSGP